MPRLQCRPDRLGQRGAGPDAGGHDDEVGRDLAAVLELHRHDAAAPAVVAVADQRLRVGAHHEPEPALLERLAQQVAGDAVELALHQPRHDVHHRHPHAAQHQAVGRLQPEQPAADDDGVAVLRRRIDHRVGVGDVAVGDDALEVLARHRQDERVRPGGQQQPVVGRLDAARAAHDAAAAVHLGDRLAQVQPDAVVGVPVERVEHDLVERLLAGEHRREQDAVVVRVRLGAEHRDVVQVGSDLQQLLEVRTPAMPLPTITSFIFLMLAPVSRRLRRSVSRGHEARSMPALPAAAGFLLGGSR